MDGGAIEDGDGGAEDRFADVGQNVGGGVRPGRCAGAVGAAVGIEVHASHWAG